MAHLIQIGNSQGVRIPKPLIEEAHFDGTELSIKLVNDGILISPKHCPREGWKQAISETLKTNGAEIIDNYWLDAQLTNDSDLEW